MAHAGRTLGGGGWFRGGLRAGFATLLSISLAACALRPVPPELSREEVIAKATASSDTAVDLETAKKILNGWHNVYLEAAQSRRNWQLGFSEVLFYGSLFAVLGAIINHDHARNLGIAAAGGSSLASGHYQANVQAAAFRKAVRRLACLEEATMQITPRDEARYASSLAPALRATLYELPAKMVNRIRKVRTELGDTLNGIELATPSRDDIANAFKSLLDARQKAATVQVAGGVDALRKARFEAALEKVEAEFQICMSDGGSG